MKSKIPLPLQHLIAIILVVLGLLVVLYFGKGLGNMIGDRLFSN